MSLEGVGGNLEPGAEHWYQGGAAMHPFDAELQRRLDVLESEGLRRSLRRVESGQGREILLDGRRILNFASNDYLGLAVHPVVAEAAAQAARDFGAGSGASRLISGSLPPHRGLEDALAAWKGTESALAQGSGFASALGLIPALVGKDDIVILDRQVHACCVDGARLSGATLRICRHNDLDHLESLLTWARRQPGTPRILIITESVFSMDGDRAPLRHLVELKDRFGAWLMLDEAHAVGLFGANRTGCAEAEGVASRVEIQFGTLGKALGSCGGYVCGSRVLTDYLVNRSRSLLFSTAPVPAAAAAAREAIRVVQSSEGAQRCAAVWERITELTSRVPGLPGSSPIIPVMVGGERAAVSRSRELLEQGCLVPSIRYPTVSRGRARLRISATASHTRGDMSRLAEILAVPPFGMNLPT
jgi:8-amino-7-oxononanoate synthase